MFPNLSRGMVAHCLYYSHLIIGLRLLMKFAVSSSRVTFSIISISKLVIQPNFSFCLCIITVHFQGGRTSDSYDRMWIFEFHSLTFTFHNAVDPRGEQPSIVVRALQYIHLVVNNLATSYITYVIYTLQDRQNQIV